MSEQLPHRPPSARRRPKKRLTKTAAAKRKEFVALSAEVRQEAERTGARIWFVDAALFRADADRRGLWVLQGEPALVDSRSPRLKEKGVSSAAVCLETAEVAEREVDGNCRVETSVAFLRQLRTKQPEALSVLWDNGPAHRGEPIRRYLATPELRRRLVPLPGDSPDDKADEAIWDWVREDVTANTGLGTTGKVREKVGAFLNALSTRTDAVKRRCRTAPASAGGCPVERSH